VKKDQVPVYRWPGLHRSAPSRTRCPGCGLDVDSQFHEGWLVTFDPPRLNPRGVAIALLVGSRVAIRDLRGYLTIPPPLKVAQISTHRAGTVVREHQCGLSWPTEDMCWTREEQPGECPF
jgi:hypothetical protein